MSQSSTPPGIERAEPGGETPVPPTARTRRGWMWVVIILAVALAIWIYPQVFPPTLVGTWSNPAKEDRVIFSFKADGSGALTIGNAQLPYHYRLDRTHNPAWLDLEATVDGKPVMIRAIVAFSRGNKLKIRMPPTRTPGLRPSEFVEDDLENTILLTRSGPAS